MWDITTTFKGNLPSGFCLMEDEDFVYLLFREEIVATFSSSGVDPREIEKTAEKFILGHQDN